MYSVVETLLNVKSSASFAGREGRLSFLVPTEETCSDVKRSVLRGELAAMSAPESVQSSLLTEGRHSQHTHTLFNLTAHHSHTLQELSKVPESSC